MKRIGVIDYGMGNLDSAAWTLELLNSAPNVRSKEAVSIPVIASGGAKNYEDMYLALTKYRTPAIASANFAFAKYSTLQRCTDGYS